MLVVGLGQETGARLARNKLRAGAAVAGGADGACGALVWSSAGPEKLWAMVLV
jgi:hypothetical protein